MMMEAAIKNALKTQKQTLNTTVQHIGLQQQCGNKKTTSSNAQPSTSSNKGGHKRNKNFNNTQSNSNAKYCYCCGLRNHVTKDCRLRANANCDYCKKQGHLEKACIAKNGRKPVANNNGKKSNSQKKNDKKLHLVREQECDGVLQTESSVSCNCKHNNANINYSNFDTDFCRIECRELVWNKIKADPQFLEVQVNDQKHSMEIDTGTYVTAISEEDWRKHFPNNPLELCGNCKPNFTNNV